MRLKDEAEDGETCLSVCVGDVKVTEVIVSWALECELLSADAELLESVDGMTRRA